MRFRSIFGIFLINKKPDATDFATICRDRRQIEIHGYGLTIFCLFLFFCFI